MTQIEFIDFRLIFEDKMNPRKSFNSEAIAELAENIKQQGLLQPITVRPYPTMKIEAPKSLNNKPCYKIVMGARRYKACVKAGIDEIPCIVREMSDEQAFDAMITENLQRKDVEPMEEARAFNELQHRGTSFEELAARFGKSVSYIRLRIKLNDLIPELSDLLEKKELQISHAQELCKLNPDFQKNLFNDRYSESSTNWNKWTNKPLREIKHLIESDFRDLDKAKFDQTECINCQFRCGVNALFEEYNSNRCTKPTCFSDKEFQHKLETAIARHNEGFILIQYNEQKTALVEKLIEDGFPIIEYNYKMHSRDWPAEYPEREEEDTEEEWADAIADYDERAKIEEAKLESGEYKKAWFVDSTDYFLLKFKEGVSGSEEKTEFPANQTDMDIINLKLKDKRNVEIQTEKTVEDLRKLMSDSDYQKQESPLSEIEEVAMYAMLIRHISYRSKRDLEQKFDPNTEPFESIRALIGTSTMNSIIRDFIKENVTSGDVSYAKGTQSVLKTICKEAFPEDSTRIQLKHEETYLKRKERIDQQIKELSAK